ncbi:glycosyltransferase [Clostridium sp. JS66]|uniref:glycosyltransferase n=1 Tax=Clostridium sp. JS66 TaxID=3064705 RepID=UPI00298EC49B|nr:glycosyltransferase [Clostridium sp. JS66]WPC41026.1 glycosyltransferase [Clostridium sp. JS66]
MNNYKEKVVVFGVGDYFVKCKNIIEGEYNIIAFTDNDIKKQGGVYENKDIIAPQKLLDYVYDKIVITSSYETEIEQQLIKLGIESKNIVTSETILKRNLLKNENYIIMGKEVDNFIKRIKLLFCIDTLNGGGAEKVTVNLLNNIDYNKYEVELFVVFQNGIYFNEINKHVKIKVLIDESVPICLAENFIKRTSNKELYKYFINKSYDVEVASIEGIATKIISGSTNKNSRKIAWLHSDIKNYNITLKRFLNIREQEECYKKFNTIVVDSKGCKKSLLDVFNLNENNVKVVPTIIESENIIRLSNEQNISFNKFTFCSVGALTPVKGFDRLINIIYRLVKEGFDCNLLILGQGEDENKLKEMVGKLNIKDNVSFLGFVSNPYIYIKACNVFVLSSLSEGLSSVVCEALILGKTVISTDCSGTRELLGESSYGIVADNSEEGLYANMKRVMNDSSVIRYYEEMAKVRTELFKKEKIIAEVEKIIDNDRKLKA